MNIAVIAANGRTGQAFVKAALSASHNVIAGVHYHNDLEPHPNLKVLQGDATDISYLKQLIKNQDAVVSLIGHTRHSPKDVQSWAITSTLEAMLLTNVVRVVSLTGTGVRFPGDKIALMDHFLNFGVKFVDPARVKDGIEHVELLRQSKTDWTVIRVLKLQNTRPKPFALTLNGPAKVIVSRQEVAQAILDVLEQNIFIRQAPIVSKANPKLV